MTDSGRARRDKRVEARRGEGEFLRLAVVGLAKRKSKEMLTHPGGEEAGGGKIKVPCLHIQEEGQSRWLYESNAIIAYLEQRFAGIA